MYKIPTKFFNFLWFFIKKQPIGFIIITLTSLVNAISSTVWPYVTGNLVDAFVDYSGSMEGAFEALKKPIIIAFCFWIVIELLSRIRGFSLSAVMPKFQAAIRLSAFKYVSQHSHAYFVSNYVGGIANRISDLPRGAQMVVDVLITIFIPVLVAIIISCSFFFSVNPYLCLVLSTWLGLHLLILFFMCKKAASLSRTQSEARTYLQGKIVDTISNHLNVRLFTHHKHEEEKINEISDDEKDKLKATLHYVEIIKLVLGVMGIFWMVVLFSTTFKFWSSGIITIGEVVLVINSTLNLMAQMGVAAEEMTYLIREIGVCQQALRIFQDPVTITDVPNATKLKVKNGTIKFENVNFRYRHNENMFYDQSLTIRGGQKVGLVGFSGSGKTTFANLILRLYEIDSGKITIDDQDITQVTAKSLRKNISFIPQDPILFHRTVIDNIKYGNIRATDEEVIEAAKKAGCHEFILGLDEGYNTTVGERGTKLSGGQRQRIAIARAILKDAPIVIMDEATSALDSVMERQIRESLKYLMEGKTTLIIAHRLSTLLHVDRILVFDRGQILEDGSHTELLSHKGHYSLLWSLQQDGLLPDMNKKTE
ncbi:putative ABC transporter ATP-binding protein [endosymbiont of Acanthamoeba sp. UWC8]|uniref:ABC transporter ATP-binding protein n=1 Tax=endosymbiont of Acanthamoeba sp. UWC8 TaxID=86106 RepID=UPI0004D1B65B|nr:ABC transporter ATP-binding protein [endosymbiont of Acanthamoeba sp. UWC8]AIF81242.1 putative ABC transporter ATP-binding protein [endosymbiont of Acanthamoeba sp. UWC8]